MPAYLRLICLTGALLLVLGASPAWSQQPVTHTVQQGETLWRIAQQYDVSVEQLRRLNDLEGNMIKTGQRLVVRSERPASPEESPSASPAGSYTVQPGDTFYSIAARYEFSADTLYALNDRQTAPLDSGQTLRLPTGAEPQTHRVSAGETLSRIARQYDVSVQALRQANPDVQGDVIYTGQTLHIPDTTSSAAPTTAPDTLQGPVLSYPETFAGRLTASGAPYDPESFTVSHPTLPLGTVVLLINPATGRQSFAVVNDRGPVDTDYLLEVSCAVARQLRVEPGSEQPIRVRIVESGN